MNAVLNNLQVDMLDKAGLGEIVQEFEFGTGEDSHCPLEPYDLLCHYQNPCELEDP